MQKFGGQMVAPLVAQTVKNLPAVQETRVQYLGQEDPLEKRMATHSFEGPQLNISLCKSRTKTSSYTNVKTCNHSLN